MLLTLGVVGLNAFRPGSLAPAQAQAVSVPETTVVQLHLPSALASFTPSNELIAANGDLWLFSSTRVIAVGLQSGLVKASLHTPGDITTSPVVGPDDAIWFGETAASAQGAVGKISSDGRLHTFTLLPAGDKVEGVVSGSDGNVWFNVNRPGAAPQLGRITPTGRIQIFSLPSQIHAWRAALVPATGGGFWTTVQLANGPSIAYVSTGGKVRLRPGAIDVRTLDSGGVLWGWGVDPADLYRVPVSGDIAAAEWYENDSPLAMTPEHGALELAGDNQLYFTGATLDTSDGSPNGYQTIDPVLGTVLPDGSTMTWPIPYTNNDDSPIGTVNQALVPGPDGRLYAIGYSSPGNPGTHWNVFATTLPTMPHMRAARVSITAVSVKERRLALGLRCTGQAGRLCSGTIKISAEGYSSAQAYALGPGLSGTRSVSFGSRTLHGRLRVTVNSSDASTSQTESVSRTITVG